MSYKAIKALKKCLTSFSEQIEKIREFSNMLIMLETLVPKVLSADKKSHLYKSIIDDFHCLQKQIHTSKDMYYNATVVSLYGAYERAIKSTLTEYVNYLKEKNSDEEITTRLLKKNYDISIEALKRPQDFRLEDTDIDRVLDMLKQAHFSQSLQFLNSDLFFKKQANLKLKILNEMLCLASLNDTFETAITSYPYLTIVKKQKELKDIEEARKYVHSDIEIIDQLVERRNTVSHEGEEPNKISQKLLIDDYVSRVEALVKGIILDVISKVMLGMKGENLLQQLDTTVFSNELIGVKLTNEYIDSQTIVLILGNGVRCSPILSMKHHQEFIKTSEGFDEIGIKLIKNCKQEFKYFIIANNIS